jgi:hypothetical protein
MVKWSSNSFLRKTEPKLKRIIIAEFQVQYTYKWR